MYRGEPHAARHVVALDGLVVERAGASFHPHDVWTQTLPGCESVETFELDGSGRVVSSLIKTHPGQSRSPSRIGARRTSTTTRGTPSARRSTARQSCRRRSTLRDG